MAKIEEVAVGDFVSIREKSGAVYRGDVVEIANDPEKIDRGYRLHLYDYSFMGRTMIYQDTPATQYNETIPYIGFHPISEIVELKKENNGHFQI